MQPIESLQGGTYAFVDVETTGTSATYGQIIEIGIIRVEDGIITDTYQTLLRPASLLNSYITSLTGITNEDFEGQPSFDQVSEKILELLTDAVFVAHNARFDYAFIKNEFKRIGVSWYAKTLCTVKVSRRLFPSEKSHNLDALISRHGLPMQNRHRAYDDAYALIDFIRAVELTLEHDVVSQALRHALGTPTIPALVDPEMVQNLPHAPGVYLFYGADDELLYIGKSIDIKTRVLSHFSQDHTNSKERVLTEQVVSIEFEITSGELSALLRESELIKERAPTYNKRLRSASRLAVCESHKNTDGYLTTTLTYRDSDDIEPSSSIEGIFRTISQGKTFLKKAVQEHTLCPKLLGIEKTSGACFQYQLGKCNGACIGKEDPQKYNERFKEAFVVQRIKTWPFPGAIIAPENPDEDEGVSFIVNQWRIEKIVYHTFEGYDMQDFSSHFDYDTYKILARHLLRPDVRKQLKPFARTTHPT